MQIRGGGDLGEQAAPCPSGDGAVSKLVDLLRTIVYCGSLDVRAVLQVGQGPVLLARCMCVCIVPQYVLLGLLGRLAG